MEYVAIITEKSLEKAVIESIMESVLGSKVKIKHLILRDNKEESINNALKEMRSFDLEAEVAVATEPKEQVDEEILNEYIKNVLKKLVFRISNKGYIFMYEAVKLKIENWNALITKELYPEIAKKYNTTSTSVERDIRHSITVSWEKADEDLQKEIFGYSRKNAPKVTNSEFIAALAEHVVLKLKL